MRVSDDINQLLGAHDPFDRQKSPTIAVHVFSGPPHWTVFGLHIELYNLGSAA